MPEKISCIIPTYGRNGHVVNTTIASLVKQIAFSKLCLEIIIIDQNSPPLEIDDHGLKLIKTSTPQRIELDNELSIIHIEKVSPSVTKAKNMAIDIARGEYLFFFDDDITIQEPYLDNLHSFLSKNEKVGAVGAREIIVSDFYQPSKLKDFFKKVSHFLSSSKKEKKYQINGEYIGRVTPKSYFHCNFDVAHSSAVRVNTIRGCGWACKKSIVQSAGCFDPQFKGSALREETDLCLRIEKLGHHNYYLPTAIIHHHRQFGGCDNLSSSMEVLNSKLENEAYFQLKHFHKISPIHFIIRIFPMVLLESKDTYGLSFKAFFKITWNFLKRRKKMLRAKSS